ncbi:response regulator [Pseudomonas sp. GX19020]|uniref:response regulator n=1 Tax=Pseudomonas sp. GX19020 TaxID=2942277 RepID=UPI0020198931|nr:response regulator [Pseudomonas sp. GX19020]MCL4069271.1 response regulator [Pseudomonas sp. GX19020]
MASRLPASPVVLPGLLPVAMSLPLRGLTVLAVEDSRFASEALRLICQRSGARLRRAESLAAAASHLGIYRPDLVIVDLGLPDGRGEDLISGLSGTGGPVVLGTSADSDGMTRAMRAGAAGYLGKPLPDLAGFQAAVLAHLCDRHLHGAPGGGGDPAAVEPDPMALRDDLRLAEARLQHAPTAQATRDWLRGFLAGLALQSGDEALKSAAEAVSRNGDPGPIRAILSEKIRQMPAFLPPGKSSGSTRQGWV